MLKLENNINQKIIEILFYTFPLSFIIGNMAISLHLLLFLVISLFLIKKEQLTFRFNNSSWLLIAFFLLTTIQYQSPGLLNEKIQDWPLENNPIVKSFLLIRFLILVFVVDTLFFNKILDLKKFFLSSMICTSFISIDVIMQFLTGSDLFGLKGTPQHNSGPFGDENIAGSYLQKFSFFSIFYIFEISKNKSFSRPLLIFIIVLHALAILFAGSRMPIILFLFGCGLVILFIKNLRFTMSVSLIIFLILSSVTTNIVRPSDTNNFLISVYKDFEPHIWLYKTKIKDPETAKKLQHLKEKAEKEKVDLELMITRIRDPGYFGIFQTSIIMWKERPFLGFGLKSFRIKCWEIIYRNEFLAKPLNINCSNHSHNYYLELLSEAGIIGASLMIIFFLILLKDSFYHLKKYIKKNNSGMNWLIPIIILVFIEIWPLKTSGSFFTTWNATFFWLISALLLAASTKKSY